MNAMPPVRFIAAGATDVGRAREANEDAYMLVPAENLWILADGMGGHVAGQVASQMAVDVVEDFMCRWRKAPESRTKARRAAQALHHLLRRGATA